MIREFLKGSSIIFIGLVCSKLLALGNNIVLARFLGSSDFGLFLLGLSVFQLFTVIPNLGLSSVLPKFVSEYIELKESKKIEKISALCIGTSLFLGTVFGIISYNLAPLISVKIFHNNELINVLKILSFVIPISIITSVIMAIYRGYQKTIYKVALEDILSLVLKIVFFMCLFHAGFKLSAAYYAYVLASLMVLFLAVILVKNATMMKIKICFYDKKMSPNLYKLSWPLALQSVVWVVYSQIDRLCLGFFLPSSAIGIYGAAFSIVGMLNFIPRSFSYLALPNFSAALSRNFSNEFRLTYLKISKIMFGLSLPILIYLFVFSKQILKMFYGNEYLSGTMALVILGIGILSNCLSGPASDSLIAAGKTKAPLIAITVGCINNIILNIFLIPIYGINGAAIATCIGLFLSRFIMSYFNYFYLKIIPFDYTYIIWTIISICLIPLLLLLNKIKISILFLKLSFIGLIYIALSYYLLYKLLSHYDIKEKIY